ncbi:transcription factor [Ganoderma sinense ZZ0214-1]|uniref:Transcription factor n=1 Tax=Ganoderma sinense ZZ0214-1 TaxID=1077348 RepID=A0A2G8S6W7_9APHY|nr:transcription factor [Ganoderma sinense ZZ0214-1]
MADVPEWVPTTIDPQVSRAVKRLARTQLSEERFKTFWRSRRPFVVKDLHKDLQACWEPQFFIQQYGDTACEVQDCETGKEQTSTVAAFFSLFGSAEPPKRILKLKDWPPTANFKAMFPQLQEDFERAMPLPEYITSSGAKNLAAHFPLNSFTPDLGPKMYNALASTFDETHSGSTRLHLDMSDAVNLMTHAASARDGSAGYALWHIFAPEDTCHVRAYLNQKKSPQERGDPIHNQSYYLTQSMLDELSDQYQVRPYIIRQYLGQAIFIPAGCAHQVSNQADCVKVACDFVSPESVAICKQLWDEFRIQRLARCWPPDVIPFAHMLYWTWESTQMIVSGGEQYHFAEDDSSRQTPFLLPALPSSRNSRTNPI